MPAPLDGRQEVAHSMEGGQQFLVEGAIAALRRGQRSAGEGQRVPPPCDKLLQSCTHTEVLGVLVQTQAGVGVQVSQQAGVSQGSLGGVEGI